MAGVIRPEPWWPSPEQGLLLQASLASSDVAVRSWREWQRIADMEQIDRETYKLLPRLYVRLRLSGMQDPMMGRYRGIYRRTWYQNQMLLERAAPALRRLHDAGIPTMLLKGAALVPFYYQDFGVRSLADVDATVPTEGALEAARILRTAGWRPAGEMRAASLPFQHSLEFRSDAGAEIDLHWHALWRCWSGRPVRDFWDRALAVELKGIPTRVLAPADQLLHVCVHGIEWAPRRSLNWIADAMMLLHSRGLMIEWNALVDRAIAHHVVLPLRRALSYLKTELGAPVPDDGLRRLEEAPVSAADCLRYELTTQRQTIPRILRRHRLHYRQSAKAAHQSEGLAGFLAYLTRRLIRRVKATRWPTGADGIERSLRGLTKGA